MSFAKSQEEYLIQPLPLYFLLGLILVNFIAIFQWDPFYIGSLFAFLYIVITPGFLFLPFLTQKKFAPMLGVALSAAFSILILMLVGLLVNTLLPFFGNHQPLTTGPLLIAFDALIYLLLIFNFTYKKSSPFEFHEFDLFNWIVVGIAVVLPILACLGATILNNNGSNFLTMLALVIPGLLVLIILFSNDKISPSVPPLSLFLMALSFLLMNSMRGWYVSGHDILLEYHVFTLTNSAHLWSMALFQDPYMSCLSLTIFPTYLESLLHVDTGYIFKFFIQFIGALPVVMVYYLSKEYVSEKVAFLASFLYITFPTFMVDMAFLNRQGIAFLFFGAMLFVLFTTEHVNGWKRHLALYLLALGIVLSHYSTSYITIALLIGTYIISKILRFLIKTKWPKWFFNLIDSFDGVEIYERPILLTLPFVIGFIAIMFLWSGVITKTSTSFVTTIEQIGTSLENPFAIAEQTGPAKYSLVSSQQPTPTELLSQFLQSSMQQQNVFGDPSLFYPLSLTESYSTQALPEMLGPITPLGANIQTKLHISLADVYGDIKQGYAKILQILLIIGLIGLLLGYSFRRNLLRKIPVEYLAISIAGIGVLIGQTLLPATAVDYGLLRLFQQNLLFLALPITLGFLYLCGFIIKSHKGQLFLCTAALLFFYIILSGFLPQLTGGGRPPLSLDNYGLYYSYYTHAQEVYSSEWLAENGNLTLPIQAALFSDIKMLAYGHLEATVEVLPETTKKDSYVYFNYENVKTGDILEIVNGDVIYYHFPIEFLNQNKNLIYNNGGSEIYR